MRAIYCKPEVDERETLWREVWRRIKATRAGISRLAKCRKFHAQNAGSEDLRVLCCGLKYPRTFPSQTSYPLLQRKNANELSSLTQNAPEDCINPGINNTGYLPLYQRGVNGRLRLQCTAPGLWSTMCWTVKINPSSVSMLNSSVSRPTSFA